MDNNNNSKNINADNNNINLIKKEFENVNEKENDENINFNINVNTNNDIKEYEKNLSVNLHKNNMRRTTTQEYTSQSKNSLIYLIEGTNEENNIKTKLMLYPNDKNKLNQILDGKKNMEDKVPLI